LFLKSIMGGLQLWRHPEIWALTGAFLLLYLGYLWGIRWATEKGVHKDGAGPGCLVQVIGFLFEGMLMAAFLLLLLPTLVGPGPGLSWTQVEPMGFIAARAGILAAIAVSILTFFPVIGPFLAASPGMGIFLLGTVTYRLLTPKYLEALLGGNINLKNLYPGVWETLGYLLLALLLTRLAMLAVMGLGKLLRRHSKQGPDKSGVLLGFFGPALDALGGVLALLMYSQYTYLSMRP
jgi:hypothetical protein